MADQSEGPAVEKAIGNASGEIVRSADGVYWETRAQKAEAELATAWEERRHLEEAAELLKRRPTIIDGIPSLYDWMQDVESWKARDKSTTPAEAPRAEEPAPVAEVEWRVTHAGARLLVRAAWKSEAPKDDLLKLTRYIDQQEQSEREATGLRESLDWSTDSRGKLQDALIEAQGKQEAAEREAVELRKELARFRTASPTLVQNAATAAGECDALRSALTEAQAKLAEAEKQLEEVCDVLYNTGATRGDALTRAKRVLESYHQHINEEIALEEERDELKAKLSEAERKLTEASTMIEHLERMLAEAQQAPTGGEPANSPVDSLMASHPNETVFCFSYPGYGEPVQVWLLRSAVTIGQGKDLDEAASDLLSKLGKGATGGEPVKPAQRVDPSQVEQRFAAGTRVYIFRPTNTHCGKFGTVKDTNGDRCWPYLVELDDGALNRYPADALRLESEQLVDAAQPQPQGETRLLAEARGHLVHALAEMQKHSSQFGQASPFTALRELHMAVESLADMLEQARS